MYENFYGFKEKPFHIVPNPKYLYLSPKHQNALTYLEYGLAEGVGFILLTGEIGTGKTTLIRHILNQIESKIEVAVVFNTNFSSDQFLSVILNEFELTGEYENKAKKLDIFYQFLIKKYAEGKRVLLIIDEAQNLSNEVLEEVRMLSNLQTDEQMLLQIMLVGQPELKLKLKSPNLIQFTQRIAVNYHLAALSREEVAQYISFRIEKVGGKLDLFTQEAIDVIYKASGGIPRTINLLCDSALVYGFADELKIIDASIIDQVIQDKGGMGIAVETGDEKPSSSHGSEKYSDNDISQRLQILESMVQKINMQVEWQLEQLDRRAENYKDKLVENLRKLLDLERKRSDRLLIEYSKLKEKFEASEKESVKIFKKTAEQSEETNTAAEKKTGRKYSNMNIRSLFRF